MAVFIPPAVCGNDRLATLADYGILDTAAESDFNGIVMLARTLCAAPTALISFVAEDRQWFEARSGFGPDETQIAQSVCAHALESRELLVIPDLTADWRTRANTLVTEWPFVRFYAGAPLRAGDGQILGTLCVLDTKIRPNGLTEEQAEGLRALAGVVMSLLSLRRDLHGDPSRSC
mgnify:CR=1 FL=1